jgi:hypothetical protein
VEEIQIGAMAWKKKGDEWYRADKSTLESSFLDPIVALGNLRNASVEDVGDDSPRGGEATKRIRILDKDFGQAILSTEAVELVKYLFEDVSLEAVLIVGTSTKRIYAAEGALKGTWIDQRVTIEFEYEVPIMVESPS